MPSGSHKCKANAKCPFYLSDDQKRRRIICEGIVDKSTLALTYRRIADYDTQVDVFCCNHYERCEVYTMIMSAKYDED